MFGARTKALQDQGSPAYEYVAGVIATTAITWVSVEDQFPASRTYSPLDFIEVINNSLQPVRLYRNSMADSEVVPSYMVKPITKQAIRLFGLISVGTAATIAGDVIVHVKRLPPDVQVVQNAGIER